MLDSDDRKIAKIFKSRLIQASIPIRKVIVYGSRARGICSPESDLDICLVIDTINNEIERTISRIAWEVGFQHNRIITTIEYTPEQLKDSPLRASPFVHDIQREGVSV